MLLQGENWEEDNTSRPKMSWEDIKNKVEAAVARYAGTDEEFNFLVSMVTGTSTFSKATVTKGLHQEEGNSILPESHVTVEVPYYPRRRRYHIYFWWMKGGRKARTGEWRAQRVTYVDYDDNRAIKTANLL
ncbi:MAG TPA: hypothetical protein VH092_19000 [Urbifossiella sp.]|jgi:hypothetical protein|nr:hypothetical protein [Urbifossiella sp.]